MRARPRFEVSVLGLVTLFLMGAGAARGGPITYVETATASGSLGGNAFTNALVTITATANTSQITNPSSSFFEVPNLTTTVSVSGLGTATFTDPGIFTFVNQATPAAGISDPTRGPDILDTLNAAFATYNLSTSIGPLAGTPSSSRGLPSRPPRGTST